MGFGPGSLTPGTARQLLTTFAAGPAANWVTVGGDVAVPTTEGQFVVLALRGAAIGTAAGGLLTGQSMRATGLATCDWGAVDLANTNAIANKLGLTYLAQGGAIANDVLVNNGTVWGPAALGTILPPSATQSQNVADLATLAILPVTTFLDGTSCWVRTLDREFRLKTTSQTADPDNDTYNSATTGRLWMGAA
jgi:hypothetical protein